MPESFGPLAALIRRLDALPERSLLALARELERAKLTTPDVARFVRTTPRSYNRATVVRRDDYELLVLTWLPGQASVPHDHAGSVSAMLTLQGEAAEGCWRIAPDGYVDLEYETPVRAGELTAWHDAGVHTVRNAGTEPLVTVHVYTPPLRDFRRFVARPAGSAAAESGEGRDASSVVIVGGGFSGTMTAAQILRQAKAADVPVRVTIVERQGAVGEGLAYSTGDPAHLLNVPAGRMSAWPDRPDDFVRWVGLRYGEAQPTAFFPRRWYGEYVREALLAEAREAGRAATLSVCYDEVRRIARHPAGGWMVNFGRGPSLSAAAVVLAIGHRSPPDPIGRLWSGPRDRFIADPWKTFATNVVGPYDPVVILGSGLTAVDAVLSLTQQSRHAPITLISRRGLLPQAHASQPPAPADLQALVADSLDSPGEWRFVSLLRQIRRRVKAGATAGEDWRSVVDGLRPHTAALWQSASLQQRRNFLARLRPYWEVHRHRMAPEVAGKFHELVAGGQVRVIAGSVSSAQADEHGVRLYVRDRGDERLREIKADWVLNCTGPAASNSPESNPAIASLLVHGRVRPDSLLLGLETTEDGSTVDEHGVASDDLFVVGTLRKPAFWESTAVPELRVQAAAVARAVLAGLRPHQGE